MCKTAKFTSHNDLFFERKIKELQVRCTFRSKGCSWSGDFRDLNSHVKTCSKRHWTCKCCNEEIPGDIEGDVHMEVCTNRKIYCPNRCGIEYILYLNKNNHLENECPLQLVPCMFEESGCKVKVRRKDLPRHLISNGQEHIMKTTLLNLRLTKELHVKLDAKDEEIQAKERMIAARDQRLEEMGRLLLEKDREIEHLKSQQSGTPPGGRGDGGDGASPGGRGSGGDGISPGGRGGGGDGISPGRRGGGGGDRAFESQLSSIKEELAERHKELISHLEAQKLSTREIQELTTAVLRYSYSSSYDLTLCAFSKCQQRESDGNWCSKPFYHPSQEGQGYNLELSIDTNGYERGTGTHLSAYINPNKGKYDNHLQWPVVCRVYLVLLNQMGDYGHHGDSAIFTWKKGTTEYRTISFTFFPLDDLKYDSVKKTQYLVDDSLHFRLFVELKPGIL